MCVCVCVCVCLCSITRNYLVMSEVFNHHFKYRYVMITTTYKYYKYFPLFHFMKDFFCIPKSFIFSWAPHCRAMVLGSDWNPNKMDWFEDYITVVLALAESKSVYLSF